MFLLASGAALVCFCAVVLRIVPPVESQKLTTSGPVDAILALFYDVLHFFPVAYFYAYTVVGEWILWLRANSWHFNKACETLLRVLPSRVNDYNAMMVCSMRYALTFSAPPFKVDEREREYSTAIFTWWYRFVLWIMATFRPQQLLCRRPWLGYLGIRTNLIDKLFVDIVQKDGVKQIVILGAGFDCRAYRFHRERLTADGGPVRVIEVDQAGVQQEKLRRLKQALSLERFQEVTKYVTYVQCNFEHGTELEDVLKACPDFDPREPTLFLWEGVVWYLTEGAVRQTMKSLQTLAVPGRTHVIIETPGLEFVTREFKSPFDDLLLRWMRVRNRSVIYGFSTRFEKCDAFVQEYGFALVNAWDLRAMAREVHNQDLPTLSNGVVGMMILHLKDRPAVNVVVRHESDGTSSSCSE